MKDDNNKHKAHTINLITKAGYNIRDYIVKLVDCISDDDALRIEMQFIEELKTIGLTNKTLGGEGILGFKHSDETKLKLSKMFSAENNPAFGRTFRFSSESKNKYFVEQEIK
jgi:hypothetical protein